MIFLKCFLRAYYADEFCNAEVFTKPGGGCNPRSVVFSLIIH